MHIEDQNIDFVHQHEFFKKLYLNWHYQTPTEFSWFEYNNIFRSEMKSF